MKRSPFVYDILVHLLVVLFSGVREYQEEPGLNCSRKYTLLINAWSKPLMNFA
jgi:hypothetical protein